MGPTVFKYSVESITSVALQWKGHAHANVPTINDVCLTQAASSKASRIYSM